MAQSNYSKHLGSVRKRPGTVDRFTYLQNASAKALRGQDLGQSKLNDDMINEIRSASIQRQKLREHIKDNLSNDALAKRMGVHVNTIQKVLSYETWGHVV